MPLAKTRYTIAFRGSKKFFFKFKIRRPSISEKILQKLRLITRKIIFIVPAYTPGSQKGDNVPLTPLVATPMPVCQKRRDWSGTSHQCPSQSLTHPGCAAHDKVGFSPFLGLWALLGNRCTRVGVRLHSRRVCFEEQSPVRFTAPVQLLAAPTARRWD